MKRTVHLLVATLAWCCPTSTAATAANLVPNGDFDADLSSWTLLTATDVTWEEVDVSGCDPDSGSMRILNAENVAEPSFAQVVSVCLPAPAPGTTLSVHFELWVVVATEPLDGGLGYADFFQEPDCPGVPDERIAGAFLGLPSEDWVRTGTNLTVPSGAQSMRLRLGVVKQHAASPSVLVFFDRVYLGTAGHLFDDSLEIGSVCRWGLAQPGP